jgi:hypothetical protein
MTIDPNEAKKQARRDFLNRAVTDLQQAAFLEGASVLVVFAFPDAGGASGLTDVSGDPGLLDALGMFARQTVFEAKESLNGQVSQDPEEPQRG